MEISLNGKLTAVELNELFKTNNWQVDKIDQLENSIKKSWCYIIARNDDEKLIGYVQVISDGIRHAYILKMIVHPDFRKKGIGTKIMIELMKQINDKNMLPTLVATQGNSSFYSKFGFKTECKGLTAMCIR